MSYSKIHNPIDREVETVFKGETYSIKSKATESFPTEVAKRFVDIYPFLEVSEGKEVNTEKIKEIVKEAEEVKEVEKVVKTKSKK